MTKRAVCIGINDYSARSDCVTLPDARPDGEAWAKLLVDAFAFDGDKVTLITDKDASRQAVLSALQTMLRQSSAGDVACLFFAGHGGRSRLADGTYYETICCADAGGDISDREINEFAAALSPDFVNFTLVLDSCHSGGVFDPPGDATIRSQTWSTDDAAAFAQSCRLIVPHVCLSDPSALQDNVSVTGDRGGSLQMSVDENLNFSDSAKATLLAACRYDQNSSGTGSHGCFTQALIDTINQCGMKITHPDLLTQVRQAITNYTSKQIPQLRGRPVRLEESFLEGWNYSI
jgi:Caspase domain